MKETKRLIYLVTVFLTAFLSCVGVSAQETETLYLSGKGADDTKTWEFFCTDGARSGEWTTIEVPSCWEQQGFGGYNYGHDRQPHHEQGLYRLHFQVPASWKSKKVEIVFEGSMTDTEVKVNGVSAGPMHQGAFYRFKYDISKLLSFGKDNLLEVTVSKESANKSINLAERRADYWVFGGIFRPVYLQAKPKESIERLAIDARHGGGFNMQVFTDFQLGPGYRVETVIEDMSSHRLAGNLSSTVCGDSLIAVRGRMDSPLSWTSETPVLYKAVVSLMKGNRVLHRVEQKFGFRTIEFRYGDGYYVNGTKVRFKGVCRHTFRPEYGRTSSKAFAIEDINLIKDLNMNAVRMSHYPPDVFFLDACDSLGIYVVDELAGWQDAYDTLTAHRLVHQMVIRDVNHPCVVIWSNGNEGGFNKDVRQDYGFWDPQKRHVIEPWSKLDGMDDRHYPKWNYIYDALTGKDKDLVYMPTEFLHGLYDGGHGAGLDDYWNLMLGSKLSAGGFLWDLADEGVARRDLRDSIDTRGLLAPDGIVGAHHEKEGSYYTIKEIWSPVYFEAETPFDGTLTVHNRYHFTNLSQCSFSGKLINFDNPMTSGATETPFQVTAPYVAPGEKGTLALSLPSGWKDSEAVSITAKDPFGREIFTWSWSLTNPKAVAERIVNGKASSSVNAAGLEAILGSLHFVGFDAESAQASYSVTDAGNGWKKIACSYVLDGDMDFSGISFSFPEDGVKGARLLSRGPYRVWKNRLKGQAFGIHEKLWNDTRTAQETVYPEFKGYYSEFYAARIDAAGRTLEIAVDSPDLFLRLFTPAKHDPGNKNVQPPFPDGDISILNSISPIGTKFSRADQEGPQGEQNHFHGEKVSFNFYLRVTE